MSGSTYVIGIPACIVLAGLLSPVRSAAQVPGYPNPFGGRWAARLGGDSVPAEPTDSLMVSVTLRDTTFNGRFVVDLAGGELMPLVESESACDWGAAEFFGRFYWDPRGNPILDFVRIARAPDDAPASCGFEMRLLARPDSSLAGWWCQGSWDACRREGPARLVRQR